MKIQEYLRENHVDFQTYEHQPAYTAQQVAAAEHVSGKVMAKAVVVHHSRGYAMCVLPAHRKLDLAKAAKALHVERVELADEMQMSTLFGDSEVGAEPPFGNLYDLPTVVDAELANDDEIMFQAGDHRHAMRLSYEDYAKLARPAVADLKVQR